MSAKSERVALRISKEDASLFEQAAGQDGKLVSTWMYDSLRELAIKEIYGTGETDEFSVTPYERTVLRSVLVVLQSVCANTPDETKMAYAKKAERRIDAMVSGEKPPFRFTEDS